MWAYAIVRPDVHFTLRALPQVDFAKPPLPSTAVRILPGAFVCSPGDFAMRLLFSPIPCLCRPQSNPCSPTRCLPSSRRYFLPPPGVPSPAPNPRYEGQVFLPPQVRGEVDGVASFEGYLPRGNSLVDLSTRPSNDRCFMYLCLSLWLTPPKHTPTLNFSSRSSFVNHRPVDVPQIARLVNKYVGGPRRLFASLLVVK